MKLIPLIFAVCAGQAMATDLAPETLHKSAGCAACHKPTGKLVGPAYDLIADKYKGDAKAAETLAAAIRSGSRGTWGAVPMPPNAKVSEAEAEALAKYILAQAK